MKKTCFGISILIILFLHPGCSKDTRPAKKYRLPSEQNESVPGLTVMPVCVDNETRTAFLIKPGEAVSFTGSITEAQKIHFALTAGGKKSVFGFGYGSCSVILTAGDTMLSSRTFPLDSKSWQDVALDFPDTHSKTVTITFRRTAGFPAKQIPAAVTVPQPVFRPGAKKNIILISLDTLRADHLGCYGYDRNTSPNLDAFAGQSLTYTNCITPAPWTLPAHVSLFTGLYPSSHSVIDDGFGSIPPALPAIIPEIPTLPELMQQHGYETRAVVSHLYVSDRFGFDRGFNVFHYEQDQRAEKITGRAVSWLDCLTDRPFFLFLHYFDCHDAYDAPEPFKTMYDRDYTGPADGTLRTIFRYMVTEMPRPELEHLIALYDGEIRYLDDSLGKLLNAIGKKGLLENTLIIITADHGEEFKDHGRLSHGRTVYEEMVKVPLLVRFPESEDRVTINTQTSLLDILPTILTYLGITAPQGLEGTPLPTAPQPDDAPARTVFSETSRNTIVKACVRTNNTKLILADDFGGREQYLFDLLSDKKELKNITATAAERADSLQTQFFQRLPVTETEQVCLRIPSVNNPNIRSIQGTIKTNGTFGFIDTTGWWPEETIRVNEKRNTITVAYNETPAYAELGINLMVKPAASEVLFTSWTVDGRPAHMETYTDTGADLRLDAPLPYAALLQSLLADPSLHSASSNTVHLFKTSAIVPIKVMTADTPSQRRKIRQEDREKLKALGYIF